MSARGVIPGSVTRLGRQRAALALDLEPLYAAEAKERQGDHGRTAPGRKSLSQKIDQVNEGKAATKAAAAAKTNRQYVSDAKRLQKEAPELLDDVNKGRKSIVQANRELARAAGLVSGS